MHAYNLAGQNAGIIYKYRRFRLFYKYFYRGEIFMINKLKLFTVLIFLACFFAAGTVPKASSSLSEKSYAKEEDSVKGVWVATVFNLDFPKAKSQNANALKAELDSIVENAEAMGFNTIFFQVRPSADAFYKSEIFPWSKYLTGTEGTAPSDNFDPLAYLVDISHKKSIKVHAWINPYRVTASASEKDNLTQASFAEKYSDMILEYGGRLYLNPGIPEVNKLVASGAAEIARNYNVDGIQLDDYFYPGEDFPDDWSYSEYGKDFKDKGSWRRHNIDNLIGELKNSIKKENPDILFGVSPQGIWANSKNLDGGSETNGKEAYFTSYADTRKWVKENMIDYIIPQIYWNIGYAGADFKTLAKWWSEVADGSSVKLYIGQAAYKAAETADSQSVWFGQSGIDELSNQITFINTLKNVSGYSMYRLSSITDSPMLSSAVTAINASEKNLFSDLHLAEWAKEDITVLCDMGLVNGMGDGTFGVQNSVTRGQFAVMLSRMLDKAAVSTKFDSTNINSFSDVSPEKYYYKDICTLKALGYIQGISDTEFAPESNISRQDMSVIVYRILLKENYIKKPDAMQLSFTDANEIKPYAAEAVKALTEEGIINGYEDNSFRPFGTATRAESAVIINRILKLIK